MDISSQNEAITQNLLDAAHETAPPTKCNKTPRISTKTKQMMNKRREMKQSRITDKIEYVELCKTVRKCIKSDIRRFNTQLITKTLEENLSLKKLKR